MPDLMDIAAQPQTSQVQAIADTQTQANIDAVTSTLEQIAAENLAQTSLDS